MTALASTIGAYRDGRAHLGDELERIDLLLKIATLRWRRGIAATKEAADWGLLRVDEAEVDAFLDSPFRAPWTMPQAADPTLDALLAAARRAEDRIAARLAQTPAAIALPVRRLGSLLGGERAALDILLVTYLAARDERYRRLVGYLRDDVSRMLPSVELALAAAGAPDRASRILGPEAPLVELQLLRVQDQPDLPYLARDLVLDEPVATFLETGAVFDPPLADACPAFAIDGGVPAVAEQAARWLGGRPQGGVVLLRGPDPEGCLATAAGVAQRLGRPLLPLDGDRLLAASSVAGCLPPVRRAALLEDALLALLIADDDAGRLLARETLRAMRGWPVRLVLAGPAPPEPRHAEVPEGWLALELPPAGEADRRRLWSAALGAIGVELDPAPLAARYPLTPAAIRDTAAALAARRATGAGAPIEAQVAACIRRRAAPTLLRFGHFLPPRADGHEELVIPPAQVRQLEEVEVRLRLRHRLVSEIGFSRQAAAGTGFVVLLAGPSGVGKSLAAEVLARGEGGLYRVDLAAVVSKYVGETERHLRDLFEEARALDCLLFFDEADALFGKRGEIKDARDRWANLEVDYLLQLIEAHAGAVVLATNLRQNLDEAFLRRIHAVIELPLPDERIREQLWTKVWPAGVAAPAPAELHDLAQRLQLTGAAIRGIAEAAAALALGAADEPRRRRADGRLSVTLDDCLLAAARTYQKLGRPLSESEFGPLWHAQVHAALFNGH